MLSMTIDLYECTPPTLLVQAAKAQALGPRHDISALSTAVAEPWLSVVVKDAAAAEQSGWFWTYKLESLEVRFAVICLLVCISQ